MPSGSYGPRPSQGAIYLFGQFNDEEKAGGVKIVFSTFIHDTNVMFLLRSRVWDDRIEFAND